MTCAPSWMAAATTCLSALSGICGTAARRSGGTTIWVKQGIDVWTTVAGIDKGRLLRSVSKSGKVNRDTLSDWAVWSVVEQSSKQIGIEHFGAHDLRRTCAKVCRKNGGDLEQIKFLLGHSSIQTTERYLGSEQDIENRGERQPGTLVETATSRGFRGCHNLTSGVLICKHLAREQVWF
jgi:integrase